MNVSKFFRRYSRIMLMIFMSLLLVVFLVGDVLQNLASRRANPKQKVGRAFGTDIYTTDVQLAGSKQDLLELMGFGDLRLLEDPLDVYLLLEEARRMGARTSREQVKTLLAQRRVDARVLEVLQRRTGRSYNSMFDIAGEWLAVLQLVSVQADALDNSLPRAEVAFRDQTQAANVQLSVLDAHAFLSSVPEPTEEELQAFFEETKDRPTEHTEDEIRFGYLLPDRVRLEYLTVSPEAIESMIHPRARELRAFFEDHSANYQKKVAPPDTQSTQPLNQPASVPMTFEEARASVLEDCRADKAIREAQSLVNEIRHAAYLPWQASARGDDRYREPPPEGTQVSFEALRDRFSENYPVDYKKTELLDQEAIRALFDQQSDFLRQRMGSREPMYFEGQVQMPISKLAMRVKGIFTPEPEDYLPALNLFEPSPVLIRRAYNPGTRQPDVPYQAYVFRVIEVAPEGPPASREAVGDQLVEDYKLLKAYEMAAEHARRLGERARQEGLAKAVEEAAELRELLTEADENYKPAQAQPDSPPPPAQGQYVKDLGPNEPTRPFTRNSQSVQWVGQTQKVQRETFALAEHNAGDEPAAHQVAVVEVADLFKVVVVELEKVKPLYAVEFERQRPLYLRPPGENERAILKGLWITPQNVRERTGFEPVAKNLTEEAPEPAGS